MLLAVALSWMALCDVNDITAGSSAGITWDEHGHVTGFGPVPQQICR